MENTQPLMSRTLNDIIGSSEFKCFFELMLRDTIGGQLFGNGTRKSRCNP